MRVVAKKESTLSEPMFTALAKAAELLGVTRSDAKELISSGALTAVDLRHPLAQRASLYVRHSDVEALLPGYVPPPQPEKPLSVHSLKLSTRSLNRLVARGVQTLDKLVELTDDNLLKTAGLGHGGLREVERALDAVGLTLTCRYCRRTGPHDPECRRVKPRVTRSGKPGSITRIMDNLIRSGDPGAPVIRVARRLRRDVCGVYVIRCKTTGRYKIGKSVDVAIRLKTHARQLWTKRFPGPMECVRVIPCTERMLGFVELVLHWLYDESREGSFEFFDADLFPKPETIRTVEDVLAVSHAAFAAEVARGKEMK